MPPSAAMKSVASRKPMDDKFFQFLGLDYI